MRAHIHYTSVADADADLVPMTTTDSGRPRSSTGARVVLKPKARYGLGHEIAMQARDNFIPRRGNLLRRWNGRERIAKTVHRSALDVNATKTVCLAECRGFAQQRSGLARVRNVSAKQDDAGRTHHFEPRTLKARKLGALSPTTSRLPAERRKRAIE